MKKLLGLAAMLGLLLAGANAVADDASGKALLERDNAAWRPLKLLVETHQSPPAGWQAAEDPASGLKFAAPCGLQRTVEKQQGIEFPTYLCRGDGLAYAVIVSPTNQATQPDWLQSFWIGHDAAMLARLQKRDPAATLTPLARISYQGFLGRQHRIEGEGFAVITRLLPSPRGAITMFVAGPRENLPGDSERFFSAMDLRASGKND